MNKRLRFFLAALMASATYLLVLLLPYNFLVYGLLLNLVVVVLGVILGLGVDLSLPFSLKLGFIILPILFSGSFSLFSVLLPLSWLVILILVLVYLIFEYVMMLIFNIFIVTYDQKTPALYRSAVTVSNLMVLVTSFFVFNTIQSFHFSYYFNAGLVFISGFFIFTYWQWVIYWGEREANLKDWILSAVVPALVLGELEALLSFWPVGIFLGSIFLVLGVYTIGNMLELVLKGRDFEQVWKNYIYLVLAALIGAILTVRW